MTRPTDFARRGAGCTRSVPARRGSTDRRAGELVEGWRPQGGARVGDDHRTRRRGLTGKHDRLHHGRPLQAVCLWSQDVIDALRDEGHPIRAGAAGENLTVSGIDWDTIRPGVRHLGRKRGARHLRVRDAVREERTVVPRSGFPPHGSLAEPRLESRRTPGWSPKARSRPATRSSSNPDRGDDQTRGARAAAARPGHRRVRPGSAVVVAEDVGAGRGPRSGSPRNATAPSGMYCTMYALRTSSVRVALGRVRSERAEHDDAARAHRHLDRRRPVAPALLADRCRRGARAFRRDARRGITATQPFSGVASVIAIQHVRYACGST